MVTPTGALMIGSHIGPYRIVGELGSGGMGLVYRAAHTLLGRPAAIKVLRPELSDRADAIERFLAEACTTAEIRHPGVVEVYDYGYSRTGHAFLAMELLDGQTLGARLVQRGRMTAFEAMVVARRIAAPLAVAHRHGIVHRDLKPDNVFLVRDLEGGAIDQVKLLDFGVAKPRSPVAAHGAAPALVLGTPAYMSPEQCRGDAACDQRTDLYALGCILFELLTGQAPYGSRGAADELVAAHLRSPVPDVSRQVAVPPELARLVTRLLAKRVEDRPRDAIEVVAALDRWLVTRGPGMIVARGVRRLASLVVTRIAASWGKPLAGSLSGSLAGALAGAWVAPWSDRPPQQVTVAPNVITTSAPTQPMAELAPSRHRELLQPLEREL